MNIRAIAIVIVLGVGVLGYVAWRNNSTPGPAPAPQAAESAAPEAPHGGTEAATSDPGVTWQVPKRWVEELGSGMRFATYVVPDAKARGEDGECAVYYFGPGQGGGVEPNLTRWIGEFENARPARSKKRSHGLEISRVRVTGTYVAHSMSTGEASAPRNDWALLGAIVEGPRGTIFFKLVGPAPTVLGAEKEFDGMLASLAPR